MVWNRRLLLALLLLLLTGCGKPEPQAVPAPTAEEIPPWEVWREGSPTPERGASAQRRGTPDVEPWTAGSDVAKQERTALTVWPDDPRRGPAVAKVTIVEFDDFQCVYCRKVTPTLRRLLDEHSGDVRIVFKHYPLMKLHKRAEATHRAAEALFQQGNDTFWAFYDLAHEHHDDLSDGNIERWVVQAGGDLERWRADLTDSRIDAKIAADKALGKEAGVTGTPNFFINGTRLTGAKGYDAFEAAVAVELARANQALARGVTMVDLYDVLTAD
jgi:protein-disulfide isomerase